MEEGQQVQHPAAEEVEILNGKKAAIAVVIEDWRALETMSDVLKGDRDVVMAAVTKHGMAIKYSSEELRSDKEVVLAAVTQHGRAFFLRPKNCKEIRK